MGQNPETVANTTGVAWIETWPNFVAELSPLRRLSLQLSLQYHSNLIHCQLMSYNVSRQRNTLNYYYRKP